MSRERGGNGLLYFALIALVVAGGLLWYLSTSNQSPNPDTNPPAASEPATP